MSDISRAIRSKYNAGMDGNKAKSIIRLDVEVDGSLVLFMAQGGNKPSFPMEKSGVYQCIYLWTMISKKGKLFTSSSYLNKKNELVITGDSVATKSDAKLWLSHGLRASDILKIQE